MSEERLKQVAEVIAARRVNITLEEARELGEAGDTIQRRKRAVAFAHRRRPLGEANG